MKSRKTALLFFFCALLVPVFTVFLNKGPAGYSTLTFTSGTARVTSPSSSDRFFYWNILSGGDDFDQDYHEFHATALFDVTHPTLFHIFCVLIVASIIIYLRAPKKKTSLAHSQESNKTKDDEV